MNFDLRANLDLHGLLLDSLREVVKARTTKYLRRYKGKDGKWRYVYPSKSGGKKRSRHEGHETTHSKVLGDSSDKHYHAGASFAAGKGKGHYIIEASEGGQVTFHLDEDATGKRGETQTMSRKDFRHMLREEHREEFEKAAKEGLKRRQDLYLECILSGVATDKQIKRAADEVARWQKANKAYLKSEDKKALGTARGKLFSEAKKQGISNDELREMLGVSSMSDNAGEVTAEMLDGMRERLERNPRSKDLEVSSPEPEESKAEESSPRATEPGIEAGQEQQDFSEPPPMYHKVGPQDLASLPNGTILLSGGQPAWMKHGRTWKKIEKIKRHRRFGPDSFDKRSVRFKAGTETGARALRAEMKEKDKQGNSFEIANPDYFDQKRAYDEHHEKQAEELKEKRNKISKKIRNAKKDWELAKEEARSGRLSFAGLAQIAGSFSDLKEQAGELSDRQREAFEKDASRIEKELKDIKAELGGTGTSANTETGDHGGAYDWLGVTRDASPQEVKEAFREKAKTAHPDRGGDEEEFKKLKAAYDVLGDPEKRRRYDSHGSFRKESKFSIQKALTDMITAFVQFEVSKALGDVDLTPTDAMASNARRGLEMRKKASDSNKGGLDTQEAGKQGIGSGVARAASLANKKKLSPETVRQMKAFFDRHSAYKHKHKSDPGGKAQQSWLLWGGDAAYAWAKRKVEELDRAKEVRKAFGKIDEEAA